MSIVYPARWRQEQRPVVTLRVHSAKAGGRPSLRGRNVVALLRGVLASVLAPAIGPGDAARDRLELALRGVRRR